jgi:hypothetical protein
VFDFGSVEIGASSAPLPITVTNTGGGILNVGAVTIISVTDLADFPILGNTCTVGLPNGGSCVITVGFSPTVTGAKEAQVSIVSNDAVASPSLVNLDGLAVVVPVAVTATVAGPTDFGTRRSGSTRTRNVLVTNDGTAPLTITSVSTSGAPFSATLGTCNVVVAAGRSCRLQVTYSPGALGPDAGTVTVVSDATNSPTSAALTGVSRAPLVLAALRIVQPPAPTALRPITVSLRVSLAATIRVQVRRTNGKLVWSKVTKVKKAGASKVRWNLRDSKGRRVKAGRYVFTITATDAFGDRVVTKKTVRVR